MYIYVVLKSSGRKLLELFLQYTTRTNMYESCYELHTYYLFSPKLTKTNTWMSTYYILHCDNR